MTLSQKGVGDLNYQLDLILFLNGEGVYWKLLYFCYSVDLFNLI